MPIFEMTVGNKWIGSGANRRTRFPGKAAAPGSLLCGPAKPQKSPGRLLMAPGQHRSAPPHKLNHGHPREERRAEGSCCPTTGQIVKTTGHGVLLEFPFYRPDLDD